MNATGAMGQLRKKERGVALLLCIFALMLITGIAVAMLGSSDTETAINSNYRDTQKAYFSAMGGVQEARVRLLTDPTVVPTAMPSTTVPGGVVYIVNPSNKILSTAIAPWTLSTAYYDDELCHESFPSLTNSFSDPNRTNPNQRCTTTPGASGWYTTLTSTDPNTGTAAAMDYRWVRITMKENRSAGIAPNGFNVADPAVVTNNSRPICWDGFKQVVKPDTMTSCSDRSTGNNYETVYRIASLAVTNTNARRMVIAEVAKTPPFITNAAVDSQDHVTLNGQLTVSGYDYCTCSCTTDKKGVTTCVSRAGKTCDTSKYAIYAASTVDNPNNSETIVAGTTPPIAASQAWNYDIPGLINMYKPQAVNVTGAPYNFSCSGGSCGTQSGGTYGVPPAFPPTPPDTPLPDPALGPVSPQITYFPGSVQLTGGSVGNGILIVDGDLDIHGGLQFYGLILVKGVVKFTGGGSDKTNIFGAVLAGQETYADNTFGGSAVINFNACALSGNTKPQPPSVISVHEAAY